MSSSSSSPKAPKARVHHYNTEADVDGSGTVAPDASTTSATVQCQSFYNEYHGHSIPDLNAVLRGLRKKLPDDSDSERNALFLLGDSSFDNKYWFNSKSSPLNGYENVLGSRYGSAPTMTEDIAYWVNKHLVDRSTEFDAATDRASGNGSFCLNCAVEESTLSDRFNGELLAHDEFVRDNLRADDMILISAGGNDIALRPGAGTIANMLALLLQPSGMIESGWCIGLSHFITLFKTKMEGYIRSITAKTKPKLVVVCMIYYLDEIAGGSWADGTLKMLGYNRNPAKLQMLIRKIFTEATCKIEVEGVKVLHFPLFEVLDGKTTDDYCQRVEPSSQGGNKIGKELVDRIILSEQLHAESERYVAAAAAAANGGGADAAAAGGSSSIQEKIP